MQENQHKCVEEIRFDAYAKAGEPSPQGASPGAFGQPATSATPFGASPSAGFGANVGTGGVGFGSTALNPSLGSPSGGSFAPGAAASPFGATGSAFGASAGSASPFGVLHQVLLAPLVHLKLARLVVPARRWGRRNIWS